MRKRTTRLFKDFFKSEKSSGVVLVLFTLISILISNSSNHHAYQEFWHFQLAGMSIEQWVNDVLMSFFFLLIGLELKNEFQNGELSSFKKAVLPIFGAIGGMLIPASIFLAFNYSTPTQSGYGIPMATDIAFALGALSLLGKKVPFQIKVFLTALAVIDDLGAIIVIAIFYTYQLIWLNVFASLAVFLTLLLLNRFKVKNLFIYIIGGIGMWYFMHQSGIHATITGVLLAFTIPSSSNEKKTPSEALQRLLHFPVPFLILPIFAMANTAIIINADWTDNLLENYSLGVFLGLVFGKPIGITVFLLIAVKLKLCELPHNVNWIELIGVSFLAGIGFTMSIFITLLAYDNGEIINNTKLIILLSSLSAGIIGFIWLSLTLNKKFNLK